MQLKQLEELIQNLSTEEFDSLEEYRKTAIKLTRQLSSKLKEGVEEVLDENDLVRVYINDIESICKYLKVKPSLAELNQLYASCSNLGLREQTKLLKAAILDLKSGYKDNRNYEVYAAKSSEDYLYIGSGISGRHTHCTSGTSHCYDLNRLHHLGTPYTVNVLEANLTKSESLALEKVLIVKHKPKFNKMHNGAK